MRVRPFYYAVLDQDGNPYELRRGYGSARAAMEVLQTEPEMREVVLQVVVLMPKERSRTYRVAAALGTVLGFTTLAVLLILIGKLGLYLIGWPVSP